MADAKQIASYFIDKAGTSNENDLTNLKLQKILFYAQAEQVKGRQNQPLFNEQIEAWDYGPVVPSIYHWLKGCGAYPISAFDIETDTSTLEDGEKQFLDKVWDAYGKYSATYLVTKTHEPGSPWAKAFEEHRSNPIPVESLQNTTLQNEW